MSRWEAFAVRARNASLGHWHTFVTVAPEPSAECCVCHGPGPSLKCKDCQLVFCATCAKEG